MAFLTTLRVPAEYQDALGRLRVSNPKTVHDAAFYNDRHSIEWAELTSGTGATISFSVPTVVISSTGAAVSKAVRQSRFYAPYTPGKSILAFIVGILETSGGVTGSTARLGVFDDSADKTVNAVAGNGFFFQQNGVAGSANLSVVQRSNVAGIQNDNVITQANWNIDKLDGTGKSGVTINIAQRQVYYIEFDFLGSGTVVMGIVVGRALVPCHMFTYGNTAPSPGASNYLTLGSLPVRYELRTAGTGGATVMHQISSTIISEGGFDLATTRARTISPLTQGYIINGGLEVPIMSVRLKSARNRSTLSPVRLSAMITTTGIFTITVYRFISPISFNVAGPLSAPSWTAVNSTSVANYTDISCAEFDQASSSIDVTGVTYPFIVVGRFSLSGASGGSTQVLEFNDPTIMLNADILGNSDWLVVTAIRTSGAGSDTLYPLLTWVETA